MKRNPKNFTIVDYVTVVFIIYIYVTQWTFTDVGGTWVLSVTGGAEGGGESPPRPGYLYLVRQDDTLNFKIGRTGDPRTYPAQKPSNRKSR